MTTFSKDQIEEMRRRNERRKARHEMREQPPESSGGLVGKYLAPVYMSEPVQKYIEYPRRGATEGIQRWQETQQAGEQGGNWGQLAHGSRELLSDVLDIGSDLSGGLIPESWGERVDPSSNTELGALVETQKDRFRKEHGRNPSMTEEYDIMAGIQDAKFPWLTERRKWGPVEFSNRMLIELPGEAFAAVGEIALTSGTASMAKAAGKYGIKTTAQTTVAQAAKQKTIRAAAVTAEQTLLIPKRIDDLMGAVISKPLKLGAKTTVGSVKITKRVLVKAINQFRRKAQEEGLPMNQVNAKAKETWEQAVNEGHVEDVPPNTQLRFADFFDEAIDAPKVVPEREVAGATGRSVQETLDEINRLNTEAFEAQRLDNIKWSGQTKLGNYDPILIEGFKDIPKTMAKLVRGQELTPDELSVWNKYKEQFADPTQLNESHRLRKQQVDIVEEAQASAGQHKGAAGQDNVMGIPDAPPISHRFSTMERVSDTVKMVSTAMDDAIFNINSKLHQRFNWIPERVRREGATTEETSHKRLANDIKEGNKDYNNNVENIIESATAGVGSRINFAISYLAKTWPGLIKTNVGGAGSQTKKRFDLDTEAMAARGELIDDLLESGGDEYNFIVSDGWFKAQNIDKTVTGYTLISQGTKEKMSAWAVGREGDNWVAKNLEPGFADVAERLDKYEDALRAVTHEVTEEVAIAGKIYEPGDTINAYDIIKSIADEVTIYEDQLIRDGVSGAGQAIGVTNRYFPHNVIAGEITESGKLPKNGVQEIDLNVNPDIPGNYWGTQSIKTRQFLSQAEGMLNNRVYVHPAQAAVSQVKAVGEHIRNTKLGKWINQVATENNMTHGTLKELMWNNRTGRSLFEAITKIRYTLQNVGNRQTRAKIARQPHLIGRASEMLGRRVDLETGRIISDTGEVIAEGQQLGFGDLDLTLPFNLRGARPKMGSKTPLFESDLDKVLYIIRSKARASAGEPGYFEWLESRFPGVSRKQFREVAESVRTSVVKLGRDVAEGNDIEVPISVTEGNVNMADELTRLSREALGEDDVSRLIADMETSIEFQPKITPDDAGTEAIEAELKRLREDIIKWGKDVDNLAAKNLLRDQEKKALKAQLKELDASYERLKKEVTQDMGQLSGIHMEGHYFPKVFAAAIRDGIQEDVKRTKEPGWIAKHAMWLNSFLRTLGATYDLSGIGIQGWTAVMNDVFDLPAKYLKKDANGQVRMKVYKLGPGFSAFNDMVRALGTNGEAIVAEFFTRNEILAKQLGLPTPTQAAQEGLAILAHAPDIFDAGRGIPFIKNFDRAFTHYGNLLRYDLFIQEFEEAMLKLGKTSQQLLDEGYGKEVAGALNAMTGVGRRGYGGNFMQFAVFAPRFFEARLRFAKDSLKGAAKKPGGRATVRERLASRRMAKFLGAATFLTFMINEAQGEETDINPFIRSPHTGEWHWNSNFMRVHLGQLDVSLFSSFDSFMRLMATPALALFNQRDGLDVDDVFKKLHTMVSAPATSIAIDVTSGRDAMGRETRPSDQGFVDSVISWQTWGELLDHTVPFSWNEFLMADPGQESIVQRTFEGMEDVVTGDVVEGTGDVLTGASQTGLQVVGSKSAYESISETMNEVYAEVLNLGPANVELQEAFGMTEQELRDYLADKGRGVLNDNKGFDFSLSFLNMIPAFANETPSWTQIASDYQKNIKKKLEDGVFQNIMSAEEAKQVEARIQERVEASAEPYSKYQIARDAINDAEQESMQAVVDEFFKGGSEGSLDFSGLLKDIRLIRKDRGDERRDLLEGDHAPFKGLKEDLFDFGRTSALGNLSSADADVYDYAQAHYYDLLYGVDGIIDGNTKQVDWNKRDEKMSEWATDMDERYPHLSSAEVLQYRLRIETSARKDAPPVAQQLFEMSRMISDSKYYELEEEAIRSLLPKVGRYDAAENLRLYKHWQTLDSKGRDNFILEDRKGRLWLGGIRSFSAERTREYLKTNPDIDALIQITGDYNRVPQTDRGTDVKEIIQQHSLNRRRMDQDEIVQFLDDVITGKDLTKYKELPPLTIS